MAAPCVCDDAKVFPKIGSQVAEYMRVVPVAMNQYERRAVAAPIENGESNSTRHYKSLRWLAVTRGLAYSIGAGLEPLHDVTLLEIEGSTGHGKLEELIEQTLGLLNVLRDTLCAPEELDKVKRRYRHDVALLGQASLRP